MFRITTFILSLLLVLGFNILGSAEITNEMIVAAWLFDGDAKDVSGNGFDGELKGGNLLLVRSAKQLS